jgi:membrane-bound ClpP family serine protease
MAEIMAWSLAELVDLFSGQSLLTVYWVILGAGFLLMMVAVLLGAVFSFGDDGSITPVVGIFMGLFGAVGIVVKTLGGASDTASVLAAGVCSTTGASAFYFIGWKWLKAQEGTLVDHREDLVGRVVEVTLTIMPGAQGMVSYTTPSGRNSMPARALDNSVTIRQGEFAEVVQAAGTLLVVRPAGQATKSTGGSQ